MLIGLALGFLCLMAFGYRLYSGWIARQYQLSSKHSTPAHAQRDDVDFVPTHPFYLFGQHFSAIAAAGPIAGPIIACQLFGWGPSLLWILLGAIFIGAVHDFSSLVASMRHKACSMAEIAQEYLGKSAGRAMLVFIWFSLGYIILAFTDITAGSFVRGTEELTAGDHRFNPGGAVAAASVFYLLLSIVLGLVQRFLKPPLWLVTLIFVPAAFALSYVGTFVSDWFLFDVKTWALIILGYCFLASILPVWLLLQPRGYLGGFILYAALAAGLVGILFGGYEIQQPFFKGFEVGGATGSLFPFLFVTIACGACSGFHGLVCGGTTSKQVDQEPHSRAIGYGAMLAESFVALIAIVTVITVSTDSLQGLKPGVIYGNGIGNFLSLLIGKENLPFAITFGAMAFSTFVFDTIDVATRLGRYILQELFSWKSRTGAAVGTLLTLSIPVLAIFMAQEGSWIEFWTLFGAANQLLAGLTLLCITAWLIRSGRSFLFTLLPMAFVLVVTIWALSRIVLDQSKKADGLSVQTINALVAGILIALAVYLLIQAVKVVRRR